MHRRGRPAFSFGELLIAIMLLALIIVVVVGLFVKLMNASTKGLDQTVALDIAQNKLDFAAASTPAKWTFFSSEPHSITDPRTPTPFYYVLTAKDMSSYVGPPGHLLPPSDLMGDLYKLDIDVYWWPANLNVTNVTVTQGTVRQEIGRLSVHLSRAVYIANMKPFPVVP